jgi:hypothetical protein
MGSEETITDAAGKGKPRERKGVRTLFSSFWFERPGSGVYLICRDNRDKEIFMDIWAKKFGGMMRPKQNAC